METLKSLVKGFGIAIMLATPFTKTSLANEPASTIPLLVALDSEVGMVRLKECDCSEDFYRLIRYFSPQKNLAYCGVASSVMVLNALPVPKPQGGAHGSYPFYTQENYFSPEASAIKRPEKVAEEGMSLVELTSILNAHAGVEAKSCFASATTFEDFRTLIVAQLNSVESYVLVNYLRKALGQQGGGHISPVCAYHKPSDSFLILDVSQYKYSPAWVPAKMLWQSMLEKTEEGSLSRGFVMVKALTK